MTIVTRSCHAPSDAERYNDWHPNWARKFYGAGYHRTPRKPRVRMPYPDVQMTRDPVPDCPQRDVLDERTPFPQRAGRDPGKD